MIPYFELQYIQLGPLAIPVFSLLALTGIATALWRGARRAQRLGVWPLVRGPFAAWVLLSGFAGAVLLKLVYYPYLFESNGLGEILRFRGIASFGGLFGGFIGTFLYCRKHGIAAADATKIIDVMAYVFPLSWAIGRLGCALVHDHPGIRSDSWLAVRYPDWPRYDLGVLGFLFLLFLAVVFRILDSRPRQAGFFTAAALLAVGTFRLWIDQYQVDPPRYHGWSVDQYNALILLSISAALISSIRRRRHLEAL